ncbi:MAG: hypothetical protein J5I98_03880 [Phaeodactylibacter sp.]|nr:hypothetical protein [Phaeodactylibacter sp.]
MDNTRRYTRWFLVNNSPSPGGSLDYSSPPGFPFGASAFRNAAGQTKPENTI